MQGRTRTSRPDAERLEPGTYQMILDRAFVTQGMPAPQYLKKGKTQEESAYAQLTLVWKDSESDTEVRDSFLKMPEYLEFSDNGTYKSKFQKRLENLLNKQLDDASGEKLTLEFDFIETWEELKDAIAEGDQGRPAQVAVKALKWDGRDMFGHEWLVTVDLTEKGYNNVTNVAPLPKKRNVPAPATQQEPPARKAATTQKAVPEPAAPAEEADMPF